MIEDFEKCALIAKYLHMTSFYIENEVTQAKNNLLKRQRTDVHALLEYHRQLVHLLVFAFFHSHIENMYFFYNLTAWQVVLVSNRYLL